MSLNLPNPSLVGILLAVSTHNGPQIVYQYPPNLSSRQLARDSGDYLHDVDDEDYESDRVALAWAKPAKTPDLQSYYDGPSLNGHANGNTQSSRLEANSAVTDDKILGLDLEPLGEMLCPPRAMCNRRYDVMLGNVVFLGLPVHANSLGAWRGHKASEDAPSSSLSMFHLVFVMDPPDIERSHRVDEMFYHIVLKLAVVLRYEQHKHDYVWQQTRQILRFKEAQNRASASSTTGHDQAAASPHSGAPSSPQGARDTVLQLDATSGHSLGVDGSISDHEGSPSPDPVPAVSLVHEIPLCRLIAQCYLAVLQSQIANLTINGKTRLFQIPLRAEFPALPRPAVPYIPGLYLSTTARCLGAAGHALIGDAGGGDSLQHWDPDTSLAASNPTNTAQLSQDFDTPADVLHLALLLCDEPDAIVRDIKASSGSAIAAFLTILKPTESLSKAAGRLLSVSGQKLHPDELKTLALHLVYWRRARLITPLNTRAIYIVSPMAPLESNFHRDIGRFARHFPTVPSLPLFLTLLLTRLRKPRSFSSIIPSRDHKDIYLQALAWLVRSGYVTQLHTYIWLKVLKKVKMKVEEALELGQVSRSRPAKAPDLAVDNSSKPQAEVSVLNQEEDPELVLEADGDTVLVDPGRALSLERRWINRIIQDECQLSPELTAVFYKLLKYMNGKCSLEFLLVKEDVSRTDLRKLLLAIEAHVISVRHW